jgi:RND family efflux transporter MFP subunit
MRKFFSVIKKRWYVTLILVVVVGGYFYQTKNTTAGDKKEEFYQVKRQNIKEVLTLSGEIDADEKIVLRFQTSGKLSWIGVKEGDRVKKYQTIAALDQRDVRAKLQQNLNDFVKKRFDFDQTVDDTKRLADQPTQEGRDKMKRLLEKAQYDLNNAVLNVELNQLAIEYSFLTTPIEGIVTRVDVPFAGSNITPAGAEFEIINPSTIYFSANADQSEVPLLAVGMKAKITLDAFENKVFSGKVIYVAFTPKKGETGTVYKIKLEIEPEKLLSNTKIGMTGDAEFMLQERNNVLVIPVNLVKTENKKKYVEKIVNRKKINTQIKVTDEINGQYIVVDGLKEGDLISTLK